MRPEHNARRLLGITSAKAKMWEYKVPQRYHIEVDDDPAILFDLAIGAVGDLSATICGEDFITENQLSDLRSTLKFASQFFDSFSNSKLNTAIDPFSYLCASSSFYLCDMQGSSAVLAKQLGDNWLYLDGMYLEDLLLWLLQNDLTTYFEEIDGIFGKYVEGISQKFIEYFDNGIGQDILIEYSEGLRELAYKKGSSRQLFFADVISAIIKKKIESSTWHCLPLYSDISANDWKPFLKKETFIKEIWPSQRILGEKGLFQGKSAVVQMPTSVGKTKAIELIIRSAFLSNRTSLAVVVAPFRALCHEISGSLSTSFDGEPIVINELSDVSQQDFSLNINELEQIKQVVIVTPEKLNYTLRHEPVLAQTIGLAIFDEAHLFDDANRGVNYELLLSSIKANIPENSQTVLISAVIKNTEQVADWLLEDEDAVVRGMELTPTMRSIAYASWSRRLGQLQFPKLEKFQDYSFFVPRILKTRTLGDKRTTFPKKNLPNEIALYLGLNLLNNGSIAVFCGRKDSASVICRKAVEVFKKGIEILPPSKQADPVELKRLCYLIKKNQGQKSEIKKSADIGIFPHHGNIPHGIRLAVEYALQHELIKFVVCTSTLAQGVNLPIRYLIVTSVYQGRERIKTRDFQNLIGRAGRAGKYTEGSIIFADPRIYDQRLHHEYRWRWQQANELLDPNNSEDCTSAIENIYRPIFNDRGDRWIDTKPHQLVEIYLDDARNYFNLANTIAEEYEAYSLDRVYQQLFEKFTAISAIQSYLLSHAEEWEENPDELEGLVEGTLAYSLADDHGKKNLKELFNILKEDIETKVPEPAARYAFGRTLLGLNDCKKLEDWVDKNLHMLNDTSTIDELFKYIWPLLKEYIHNRSFRRCNPPDSLEQVAESWIKGMPYFRIFKDHLKDARLGTSARPRRFKIDHVVDLCENGFGYDGSLTIGAIPELIALNEGDDTDYSELKEKLLFLQKKIKYGLSTEKEINLYELGFADRVVAQELGETIGNQAKSKKQLISTLRSQKDEVTSILSKYPSFYIQILQKFVKF